MAILSRARGAAALCALMPGLAIGQTSLPSKQIDVSAGVTTTYDSNVARGNNAKAAARGLHRSDETIAPNLSVNILYPLGRNSVNLNGSVGYDFHLRNSRLNRENIGLNGGANVALAICQVGLNAGISRRQSDLGNIGFVPTAGSVKNAETVQDYGGTLSCGNIRGFSPTASISRSIGDNSNALRERADYRSTTYTGGLLYQNPLIGTFNLYFSRRDMDYPNRLLVNGQNDGHKTDSYGVLFTRDIGTRLKTSINLAETNLKPRNSLTRGSKGLSWNVDLTGTLTSRLQLHLLVSRALTNSLFTDSSYHIAKTYGVDAKYALNDALTLSGGYSYKTTKYIQSGVAIVGQPVIQPLGNDKRNAVFSSLSYNRNSRMTFVLSGGYGNRKADNSFFNYSNKYASLGIQVRI